MFFLCQARKSTIFSERVFITIKERGRFLKEFYLLITGEKQRALEFFQFALIFLKSDSQIGNREGS
jgi:hypothetical protein